MMAVFKSLCLFVVFVTLWNRPGWAEDAGAKRPYAEQSPWNLKIGPGPAYDSLSDLMIGSLKGRFGIDPTRYTFPVYIVTEKTPRQKIALQGVFSRVSHGGKMLERHKAVVLEIPIPEGVRPAAGSDAQVIFWNPETGDEWGFWRMERGADGWLATNGYLYNTQWSGVPPMGFVSRGAGVPYLAGLIRHWEIEQGRIDHAIAMGVNDPAPVSVFPATKSDGSGDPPALPQGARLQLDPALTRLDLEKFGLDQTGMIIAQAMQEYGMIVIDVSGHPKLYAEYAGTAPWENRLVADTVQAIPYSRLRLLDLMTPEKPGRPENLKASVRQDNVVLSWQPSAGANRYRIERRFAGTGYEIIAREVADTAFIDRDVNLSLSPLYRVAGVNHNGVSDPSEAVGIQP